MRSMTDSASSATTSRRRRLCPRPQTALRAEDPRLGVLQVAVKIERSTDGAPAPGRRARRRRATIAEREEQHAPVDRDLAETRHARRAERANPLQADRRDSSSPTAPPANASSRLSVSNCRTMRQRLAPSAARTAIFVLARERARQQQVGDVGARDQQHEARPHATSTTSARRTRPTTCSCSGSDAERQTAVRRIEVGMLAAQSRGQRVELRSAPAAIVTPGFSVAMML